MADQAEKAIKQVRELLTDKLSLVKAEETARLLSEGGWTHDHPITCDVARSLGLPVRTDIPPEFLDLLSLYPQPVRHQPTVEYMPERRRAEGAQPS